MKTKIFILLFIIILTFSSCSYSKTELKNRLIIEGVGVDYDENENIYTLTVQVLTTSKSGATDSAPDTPTVNYTVKGKNIAEAFNRLGESTGKNPLFSQNRIIVMGNSLSGGRFIRALDFFVREFTSRADVFVAASTGSAADILKAAEESGEITAKIIEEAIKESSGNSLTPAAELYSVVNLYNERITCFVIPLLEVADDIQTKNPSVKVTGSYVFTGNGNINMMSDEETMFFLILMNQAKKGTFAFTCGDSSVGVDLVNSKAKIKSETRDGKPFFDIEIYCDLDIVEYESDSFGGLTSEDIKQTAKNAEKYIGEGAANILDRQLRKESCDIFRFTRRILQKDKDAYKKITETPEKSLGEIEYEVRTKVTVRRIGQETVMS